MSYDSDPFQEEKKVLLHVERLTLIADLCRSGDGYRVILESEVSTCVGVTEA